MVLLKYCFIIFSLVFYFIYITALNHDIVSDDIIHPVHWLSVAVAAIDKQWYDDVLPRIEMLIFGPNILFMWKN